MAIHADIRLKPSFSFHLKLHLAGVAASELSEKSIISSPQESVLKYST